MFFFVHHRAAPFCRVYNKQSSKRNFCIEGFACSYKTAGSAHSSRSRYVRLTTRKQGCTLLSAVMPLCPAKITCLESWFTWSEPKWLIVCCKHWNVVAFFFFLMRASPCELTVHMSVLISGGVCLKGDLPPSTPKHVFYLVLPLLQLQECNDQ